MIFQASVQESLDSRVEIDALPRAGRTYARVIAGKKGNKKARIGNTRLVPDLFFNGKPQKGSPSLKSNHEETSDESTESIGDSSEDEKGFLDKIQLINYFKKEK